MDELIAKDEENLVDLGNATELTQGYNFDSCIEPLPKDKKFNWEIRNCGIF
jgi:hypothetical protein